jgi:hypothetical protein
MDTGGAKGVFVVDHIAGRKYARLGEDILELTEVTGLSMVTEVPTRHSLRDASGCPEAFGPYVP